MKLTNLSYLAASALLACPSLLVAQSIVLPPLCGVTEGNTSASRLFTNISAGTGFRAQQIVRATAIAPDGVTPEVIEGIGYRPDSSNSIGAPTGGTFPDVVIKLSYTPVSLAGIFTTFATNIALAPQTTVYDAAINGAVVIPPYAVVAGQVAPFFDITFKDALNVPTPFVFDPTLGNLLIDITAVTTPTTAFVGIDAHQPGGYRREFGVQGALSQPDQFRPLRLQVSGSSLTAQPGGSFVGMVPGDGWSMFCRPPAYLSTAPAAYLIGFGAPPAPVDLGIIGAAGNFLYSAGTISVPATWTNHPINGNNTVLNLVLPADPTWELAEIHAQLAVVDIPANALGVVTSNGVDMWVGSIGGNAAQPLNQVAASNATAATGFLTLTGGILGGSVLKVFGPTF